jgi:hypothetical protein
MFLDAIWPSDSVSAANTVAAAAVPNSSDASSAQQSKSGIALRDLEPLAQAFSENFSFIVSRHKSDENVVSVVSTIFALLYPTIISAFCSYDIRPALTISMSKFH